MQSSQRRWRPCSSSPKIPNRPCLVSSLAISPFPLPRTPESPTSPSLPLAQPLLHCPPSQEPLNPRASARSPLALAGTRAAARTAVPVPCARARSRAGRAPALCLPARLARSQPRRPSTAARRLGHSALSAASSVARSDACSPSLSSTQDSLCYADLRPAVLRAVSVPLCRATRRVVVVVVVRARSSPGAVCVA